MSILAKELEKHQLKRMSNEESNQLTRKCLQDALIEIMVNKPFDKITITELVLRSGVSRTAFYRNYSTKEELLAELSNDCVRILANTLSEFRDKRHSYDWYYKILAAVKENAYILKPLLQTNMPVLRSLDADSLVETVCPAKDAKEHWENLVFEGAFFKVVLNWLENGMTQEIGELSRYCAELL